MEKIVEDYFNKNMHIKNAYVCGLVNRRALARRIIEDEKTISKSQFDAIIATLRRINIPNSSVVMKQNQILADFTISIRDSITIANVSRSFQTLKQIQQIFSNIPYEKNQIFKFVAGSDSAKIFIDTQNKKLIDKYIPKNDILYVKSNICEISLNYSESASSQKGIISYISASLFTNNIVLEEVLTCSPQLLLYVSQNDSLKVYELLRRIQKR